MRLGAAFLALAVALSTAAGVAWAQPGAIVLDRVVLRFWAPETGGATSPRYITERQLAFEARLEALAAGGPAAAELASGQAPADHYVRAALERHIAELLLASLPMQPEPREEEVSRQTERARLALSRRVGGRAVVEEAAKLEGLSLLEVTALLRRQARASLYVDRMVSPMLAPSSAELRQLQPDAPSALRARPFAEVKQELLDWYVSERLSVALREFFQNARSRVHIEVVAQP
jgi:hypothetical protein